MSKKTKSKGAADLNTVPFKTRVRPYAIVAPSIIITIGIMVPFVMAIWYSLTNYSFKLPNHRFIGLENWVNVLSSPDFWQALKVSLLYGIVATAVEMALGLGVAILLNNLNNGLAKVLRVLLVFPLMVAPVTATIVWQLMLNSSVGIVEKFLNVFGVYNFPWAASPDTALMTGFLIDVWVNTAFIILLVLAGLQSLPKLPFESAKIDGGSAWFNFCKSDTADAETQPVHSIIIPSDGIASGICNHFCTDKGKNLALFPDVAVAAGLSDRIPFPEIWCGSALYSGFVDCY